MRFDANLWDFSRDLSLRRLTENSQAEENRKRKEMREFEREVIDRLARIETKQDSFRERLNNIDNRSSKFGGVSGGITGLFFSFILSLFN